MRATIALALRHGVAIGAHPGFEDRAGFGRNERPVAPAEAGDLVFRQVQALRRVAGESGAVVRHVKLHGALYNLVSRDRDLARAVVDAILRADTNLVLFALAGSILEAVARATRGVMVVSEVFADRSYQANGSLTPRSWPNALITDEAAAVAQVLRMVQTGRVRAIDGSECPIQADTVCLHGDGSHPVEFATKLRDALMTIGVGISAPVNCKRR